VDDPRDKIWEDRADRAYTSVTEHPVRSSAKWFAVALVIGIVLAIVVGVINWFGAWGGTAAKLTGPQHTEEQTTAVLDDWTSMKAAAGNVCDAKASAGNGPTLVEDLALAYRATYRRIEADYDRRMSNLFEAYVTRNLPLPGTLRGLPRVAPTLGEMVKEEC